MSAGPATNDGRGALVVDVDGTLVKGDLFLEGALRLCFTRPGLVPALLRALARDRGEAKALVAREVTLAVEDLPLEPEVVALIHRAREQGLTIALASGADETQVAALGEHLEVDVAWGSTPGANLTREDKLRRIEQHYSSFDYVGNGSADLPIWRAARRAFAVNARAGVVRRARRARPDLEVLGTGSGMRDWLMSLRPHQWAKNALLLLPVLAAHLPWSLTLARMMFLGIAAFSAVASAVYLLNDLVDLPHDRRHTTKRHRPIAAGRVGIPTALITIVNLLALGAILSLALPLRFGLVLVAYALLTTAYSLALKRRAVADVMTLTTLYTMRILAGAALAGVVLSQWFLAFSIFFFLSLAMLKRVAELREQPAVRNAGARPYVADDVPTLTAFGGGAAAASSLVYCLYITSDQVELLYTEPVILWLGLLLLIYWQARMWLIGGRGRMPEDPVRFALRDRVSYLVLAAFLLTAWLAA